MNESKRLPNSKLDQMRNMIMESFVNSCEIIAKEELDDDSFQFCVDTIHSTLRYIAVKRKEKEIQECFQNDR